MLFVGNGICLYFSSLCVSRFYDSFNTIHIKSSYTYQSGWLGWAMVLGSFQWCPITLAYGRAWACCASGMEYLYSYLLEYCFFSTQQYSVLCENYEYEYSYSSAKEKKPRFRVSARKRQAVNHLFSPGNSEKKTDQQEIPR